MAPPTPSAPAPGCPLAVCARAGAAPAAARRRRPRPTGRTTPAAPGAPCVRRSAPRRSASRRVRPPRRARAGVGPGRRVGAGAPPRRWAPTTTPPGSSRTTTPRSPRAGAATRTGDRRHRAGDGVAGAVDPRAEGHRQAGVRVLPRARAPPRRDRARPGRTAAADAPAHPGDDRHDPVVGVAAPGRPARPVPHGSSPPAGSRRRSSGSPRCRREEADRRLRTVRGIGVWTSAEVRQRVLGDADAVSFGDYHLANWVGWGAAGPRHHRRRDGRAPRALPSAARTGGDARDRRRTQPPPPGPADERADAPPDALTGSGAQSTGAGARGSSR